MKFAITRTPRPKALPVYIRHLAGVFVIEIASGARQYMGGGVEKSCEVGMTSCWTQDSTFIPFEIPVLFHPTLTLEP